MSVINFPGAPTTQREIWYSIKYRPIGHIPNLDVIAKAVIVHHRGVDECLNDSGELEGFPFLIHHKPATRDMGYLVRNYDVLVLENNKCVYKATVAIRSDFEHIARRIRAIYADLDNTDPPQQLNGIALVFDKTVTPSSKFSEVYNMRASGNLNG